MNKFYFTLLNLLFVFSAFGMAADYTEPAYTHDEGKNEFDSMTDTYVETITLTNGDQEKTWSYSAPRVFWNVLSDMTMDAEGGETISAHFVAHSLGEYSETNVLQDLRFTAVVLAIDWNGDGTFEYAEKIKGNTPPTHNVGGNMDVLDFTYDIVVPDDVQTGTARVRFNFTNAWFGTSTAADFVNTCKEGIVYDFDVNLTPKVIEYFTVNVEDNENVESVVLKDGDAIVESGTQVEEGTELSIEVTPAEGYKVTDVKVNGTSVLSSMKFTVEAETKVVIEVEAIKYFKVTVADNENVEVVLKDGDVVVESGSQVEEGKELSVEATPAEGYRVTDIKVNDKSIFSSKKFTVEAESTVTVELEAIQYSVISYTIEGDEENLTKVDLYDGLYSPIANNSKLESGSEYAIYIYPVDASIEVSATLNGETLLLGYDNLENAWYYEGVADVDQTIVVKVPGEGSGLESVSSENVYYNSEEQILYTDNSKVVVYDLSGRTVLSGEGNVSVSGLEDGVYTAVIGNAVLKFAK